MRSPPTTLPAGSVLLDLMSSWVSHLPPEVAFTEVIGQRMNATTSADTLITFRAPLMILRRALSFMTTGSLT